MRWQNSSLSEFNYTITRIFFEIHDFWNFDIPKKSGMLHESTRSAFANSTISNSRDLTVQPEHKFCCRFMINAFRVTCGPGVRIWRPRDQNQYFFKATSSVQICFRQLEHLHQRHNLSSWVSTQNVGVGDGKTCSNGWHPALFWHAVGCRAAYQRISGAMYS